MTNGRIEVAYADLMAVEQGLEEALKAIGRAIQLGTTRDSSMQLEAKVESILNTVKAMKRGRE
jgi:hypothetical protein